MSWISNHKHKIEKKNQQKVQGPLPKLSASDWMGAWSSNELQCLNLYIGHQDSSSNIGPQGGMSY